MATILVVDDDEILAAYLADELKQEGFNVGTAHDGIEAVLNVLDGGWEAVLMDIRMPKLDGIGALRIIKKIATDLPIVMFTGQAGHADMLSSTQYGAHTCLVKPVSIDLLVNTMHQILH